MAKFSETFDDKLFKASKMAQFLSFSFEFWDFFGLPSQMVGKLKVEWID